MDDKLKHVIDRVVQLSKENAEFDTALRERLQVSPAEFSINNTITDDITSIRAALDIRANCSIDYSFVKDQRCKDQLIIDNLRMENTALNLSLSNLERFNTYCINAFYQIENIVNYFFLVRYPDINDLLSAIEELTATEKYEPEKGNNFRFKRNKKGRPENSVYDIDIVHKINAIARLLFPDDIIKVTLGQLRQVRNIGLHRAVSLENNDKLSKFYKNNDFNSIRSVLKNLVSKINCTIDDKPKYSLEK